MGNYISQIFVDPHDLPQGGGGFIILLFHLFIYGYILSKSSNLISDGSELLLLVPSLAGIVGSVVLPVLGAVPDGAIVLFSGLGPDAQVQLSVGVGALAGSTIMLLTIPWAICVYKGAVDIKNGEADYKSKPKLTPANRFSWFRSGITPRASIAFNGKIMIATAISYLFIQIPAFASKCGIQNLSSCRGAGEHWWALVSLLLCIIAFIGYLVYNVKFADDEDKEDKVEFVKQEAIAQRLISLSAAFQTELKSGPTSADHDPERHFNATIRRFFNRYDKNGDGTIDRNELAFLLNDVGEEMDPDQFDAFMKQIDTDGSGAIEFHEFAVAMRDFVKSGDSISADGNRASVSLRQRRGTKNVFDLENQEVAKEKAEQRKSMKKEGGDEGEEEEEEEEEEEVPEDIAKLPADQQQKRILMRAGWMMTVGTLIVLLFSDPMVDVLSELGERIHVPAFYVAFVLAPVASNASELIASINYASKKTKKSITISLAALEGAASMNNTFCLGLFLILIVAKNLIWEFSAETISILIAEVALFVMSFRKTYTLFHAAIILAIYPVSLFLVVMLEYGGLN